MTPLSDLLARLDPIQQQAVHLVYFEGRSSKEAARVLAVERTVLLAALAAAFRRIARSVAEDPDQPGGSSAQPMLW